MMRLKVAVCNTKGTSKGRYICNSFAKGIEKCGDKVQHLGRNIVPDADFVDREAQYNHIVNTGAYKKPLKWCDVAFCVCFPNRAKSQHKKGRELALRNCIEDYCKKHNKRIIYIDSGFLKSQADFELEHSNILLKEHAEIKRFEEEVYYQVGYDGIKGNGQFYSSHSFSDRWEKLGLELKPWRKDGKHILILGQTFHGQSTQTIDIYNWYKRTIKEIRNHTEREIRFRIHPRTFSRSNRRSKERQHIAKLQTNYENITVGTNRKLLDDLKDCWAAVSYSSNAAVVSIINGIPTFVMGENSIASEVGINNLKWIEYPIHGHRDRWIYDLAYTQWNCKEMREGLPWLHLKPYAKK